MRKTLFFIIISLLLISSGCGQVHRRLTIISDPPGAMAYFNDEEVGLTPVEFDFMWYFDKHRIRLEKEGYETIEVRESIDCPLHLWPPLDLIPHLLPTKIEDHREFSYELTARVVDEGPVQEKPAPEKPAPEKPAQESPSERIKEFFGE